jgi:quercetin dioxygenase-like cupin family protein
MFTRKRVAEKSLFAVAALLLSSLAFAQAPAAAKKKGPGGGVTPNPLLDRAEIRVIRTELLAGAVRAVHTHDDVKFHLFLPITPGLELTVGSDKPVMAEPGQAYLIMKSTPHGFRNTTSTMAMVYEVFVKDGPAAAGVEKDPLGAVLALLAKPGAK